MGCDRRKTYHVFEMPDHTEVDVTIWWDYAPGYRGNPYMSCDPTRVEELDYHEHEVKQTLSEKGREEVYQRIYNDTDGRIRQEALDQIDDQREEEKYEHSRYLRPYRL